MANFAPLIVDAGGVRQFAAGDRLVVAPWTFPTADGDAGQILKTDGAGNLSWDTKFTWRPYPKGL